MHRHGDIARLFCDLRYIVIDEVHALMRNDRGRRFYACWRGFPGLPGKPAQDRTVRDDWRFAARRTVARLRYGRETLSPKIEVAGTRWRLPFRILAFQGQDTEEDGEETSGAQEGAGSGRLRFQNPGRSALKDAAVRRRARTRGLRIYSGMHKGQNALCLPTAAEVRSGDFDSPPILRVQRRGGQVLHPPRQPIRLNPRRCGKIMKDELNLCTTITTATLELGIDIGKLERAFQIDAPFSVSFLQRLGRTGAGRNRPRCAVIPRRSSCRPRRAAAANTLEACAGRPHLSAV